MYCENCGHTLNEYGICPICGVQRHENDNSYNDYYTSQNYSNQLNNYYTYQNYNQTASPADIPMQKSVIKTKKKRLPLISAIIIIALALAAVTIKIIIAEIPRDLTTTEVSADDDLSTFSTTENATEAPSAHNYADKTIMMYIVGSNLESEYGAASDDIAEILASDLDSENINYLIFTGGSSYWYNNEIPDDSNAIFIVKNGELVNLTELNGDNMGDSGTLTEFLNYGYENYPAEQYGLILWNHGGGAFNGYGYDELTGDCLTLEEMAAALADSPFNDGNKLEWIGFDACLMANIETAHMLSPYSDYLVASQETEPSWGWDYSFLTDIGDMSDGVSIGKAITDSYIDSNSENFSIYPYTYCDITMSVLDLSKIDMVETALNNLFSLASDSMYASEGNYVKYSRIRAATKEIASDFTDEESYDVVDMVNLSQKMKTEFPPEATDLENALSELIVYSSSNEENANGVSIYYPYHARYSSSYYTEMYEDFNFADEYTEYISEFSTLLCGETTLVAQ